MLILDTSVLAEVLKPAPDPHIGKWLGSQPMEDLYTTSLAHADILYSVERLAPGKRRTDLLAAVNEVFASFDRRVLAFDTDAARALPTILLSRQMMKRDIEPVQAMLAAITRSRGATLVSRLPDDYAGCGIRVIAPQ